MERKLKKYLRYLAIRILEKYNPVIIAVTGSVGKTSTVRAIGAVLKKNFSVRVSPKNFNNELGVPLTVIGVSSSGGKSPIAWARIFWKGFSLIYGNKKSYPKVLVLEMAADQPGDINYLTGIARPDVAVVTAVSAAHTEFFGDVAAITEEKGSLLDTLSGDGVAVLNNDDENVRGMGKRTKAKKIYYGIESNVGIKAENIRTEAAMGTFFTRFDLTVDDRAQPVTLSEAVGKGNVYAALAASAVAKAMGMGPESLPFGLAEFHPPPGRLRVLKGIKGTIIIDDTYNSSPKAVEIALEVFSEMKMHSSERKIAVLGDMLELGPLTEEEHKNVGREVKKLGFDILVGVGAHSVYMCREAIRVGMSEDKVFSMHTAEEAGHFLQSRIHAGDMLLIKGSQGVRLEKVVKELMAEPERAEELLVRQSRSWA